MNKRILPFCTGLSLFGIVFFSKADALRPHFENDSIVQPTSPITSTPPVLGPTSNDTLDPKNEESEKGATENNEYSETDQIKSKPEKLPENIPVEVLLEKPALTEKFIEQFLFTKNWVLLAKTLPIYRKIPNHDVILVRYAQGALYRQQGKHTLAIREYRAIIAAQPDLTYVRFDLAVMLFENKEYEAAETQFQKVRSSTDLSEPLRDLSSQYLASIQKEIGWQYNLGLNYAYNNNVNDASLIEDIKIGDYTFQKDKDSLPKSANGISYSIGASRDINIQGEHYFNVGASLYGVSYWDERDYSERTFRVEAGYKKQNIQSWFSVVPFFEDTWLGDHQYGTNVGVSSEYGRWLSNKWQVIGNHTFAHKIYEETRLKRYEGNLNAVSFTAAHFISPTLIIVGGVDGQWDHLNAKNESSKKYGAQLGMIKELNNGFGGQINLRYAKRTFDSPHFFFNKVTRKDDEYQVGISVWNRNLHWKGFTPRVNYRYLKIESNIPTFYSRDRHQWFLSFEKAF